MALSTLVALAVCFSVGLILTSVLTYLGVRSLGASPYSHEYDYRWEKIAEIIIGIILISLGIAGIVAIATVPHSEREIYYWLDGVVISNIQLLSSHNVRQSACVDSCSSANRILAHSVVATLPFSSMGYMGRASGGVNNYTRHYFRS
jgi:hypothetical protein